MRTNAQEIADFRRWIRTATMDRCERDRFRQQADESEARHRKDGTLGDVPDYGDEVPTNTTWDDMHG